MVFRHFACENDADAIANVESSLRVVGIKYRFLHAEAVANGHNRWYEVIKHHTMWHIVERARFCNPRACWCHPDEDNMRIVKNIAEKCMQGTPGFKIVPNIVDKWALGFMWRLWIAGRS